MQVSPKTIELTTPLVGRQQTIEVAVKNESSTSHLAFKVKTTAPKLYCVRPNCGSIAPGSSTSVAITFQGGDSEPIVGAKCKDKFLFVGIETDSELDNKQVANQWAELESNSTPQQAKVRVAYRVVEEMSAIAEDVEPAPQVITSPTKETKPTSSSSIKNDEKTLDQNKVVTKESNFNLLIIIAILVALFAAWRTL